MRRNTSNNAALTSLRRANATSVFLSWWRFDLRREGELQSSVVVLATFVASPDEKLAFALIARPQSGRYYTICWHKRRFLFVFFFPAVRFCTLCREKKPRK